MTTKNVLLALLAIASFCALLWVITGSDNHGHHDHEHHDDHGHKEHHELVAKEPVRADGEFTITTSFYPLQFALESIVGDLGTIINIGVGVDPHDFRPTTQDILALQQSDLVVLQGAEFEPWGDNIKKQLRSNKTPVVVATAELDLREGGHHDHDEEKHEDEHHTDHEEEHSHNHDKHNHGSFDPHTWLDPVLYADMVEHLTQAIITIDPENSEAYLTNAASLQSELAALADQYEQTFANCELDKVITTHDAFGYVADRYNFEVHAIAGLSTQDTPSISTLAELKQEAEEGIGAILLEENSIAAYGETLARETGLATLNINPIAYIVPEGENYLTLMHQNLGTFSAALMCNE